MKILLLSDHLSVHAQKWAISLAGCGFQILIFSLSYGGDNPFSFNSNIHLVKARRKSSIVSSDSLLKKSVYLLSFFRLRKALKEFKPDIVHAHYATSYGFLGALTGFHPFILSVWGSDVYDFPSNSIKKLILRFNLRCADRILSTSHVMATETNKYTRDKITVTPFGVNTDVIKPTKVKSVFPENSIVIGTVKALEEKYGIEYLIRAFARLKKSYPELELNLLIVGGGSIERKLKRITRELKIEKFTVFTGKVDHSKVCEYLNMLDIYVAVSIMESESFGVAIVEASACELPVVVSRVGGLPEVVEDGKTGIVVSPKNEIETFNALEKLVNNEELRRKMGINGRKRVLEKYNWEDCLNLLISIYNSSV